MKKSLLYLFMFILIQFAAAYLVMGIWNLGSGMSFREFMHRLGTGSIETDAMMLIVTSIVCSTATLLLFLGRRWCTVSAHYVRTRPWTMLTWCALLPLGTIVPLGVMQELLPTLEDKMGETFTAIMQVKPWGYFVIGIFAPLVEEVVFRGAILRALLDRFKGRWIPILISSALFSLVHANPAQMPGALLMGLLMGWLYSHTRSIVPGLAVHWMNNTVAFIVCTVVPGSADMEMTEFFGGWLRTIMALVFSLMILIPALYQLNMAFRQQTGLSERR